MEKRIGHKVDEYCNTFKNDIKDWLQANPTIGTLNNGKFYILPNDCYLTGNVQYIAPLSKI